MAANPTPPSLAEIVTVYIPFFLFILEVPSAYCIVATSDNFTNLLSPTLIFKDCKIFTSFLLSLGNLINTSISSLSVFKVAVLALSPPNI